MDENQRTKALRQAKILSFIRRIPVFSDLSVDRAKLILALCSKIDLNVGDVLCKLGGPSDAMFILLQGKLAVKIKDSATIATITPVSSIGEMGVFTGEPRTANVEAMEKSSLLCLKKLDIEKLIGKDPRFGVSIMRKVIHELSSRIREDNVKIREFQKYVIAQEEDDF